MADISTCPPLTRSSVQGAHKRIEKYIHRTTTVTCDTINHVASSPSEGKVAPKVRLFFKCENQQRIGAFKARGAFHALGRLIEEEGLEKVKSNGVCTHSSGTCPNDHVHYPADG